MHPLSRLASLALCSLALANCGGPESTPGTQSRSAGSSSSREARHHPENHCVLPWGADWNEALDLEQAIVVYSCPTVPAGSRYTPLQLEILNDGSDPATPLTYPAGYTPAKKLPLHDFLSKLRHVRYLVTDTQTGKVRSYTFEGREVVERGTVATLWAGTAFFPDAWLSFPILSFVPVLPALPPGSYQASIETEVSDLACDGFSEADGGGCLPKGWSPYGPYDFTVLAAPARH